MCGALKKSSSIRRFSILLIAVIIIILGCTINLATTAVAQDNNNDNGDDDENETFDDELAWTLGLILVVIGIILFLAEAASPGFFIAIPATILIIIGMLGIVAPQMFFSWWSPILAVGIAIPVTYLTIKFYQKLAPPEAPTTTVGDSLIGRKGLVITATDPDRHTKGKVRIGTEIWSATSKIPINKGVRVEVIASEGVHIIVKEV